MVDGLRLVALRLNDLSLNGLSLNGQSEDDPIRQTARAWDRAQAGIPAPVLGPARADLQRAIPGGGRRNGNPHRPRSGRRQRRACRDGPGGRCHHRGRCPQRRTRTRSQSPVPRPGGDQNEGSWQTGKGLSGVLLQLIQQLGKPRRILQKEPAHHCLKSRRPAIDPGLAGPRSAAGPVTATPHPIELCLTQQRLQLL